MRTFGERGFQADGTDGVKALRQENARSVTRCLKKNIGLEGRMVDDEVRCACVHVHVSRVSQAGDHRDYFFST